MIYRHQPNIWAWEDGQHYDDAITSTATATVTVNRQVRSISCRNKILSIIFLGVTLMAMLLWNKQKSIQDVVTCVQRKMLVTMLEPGSNGALGSQFDSGWTLFQSIAMALTSTVWGQSCHVFCLKQWWSTVVYKSQNIAFPSVLIISGAHGLTSCTKRTSGLSSLPQPVAVNDMWSPSLRFVFHFLAS